MLIRNNCANISLITQAILELKKTTIVNNEKYSEIPGSTIVLNIENKRKTLANCTYLIVKSNFTNRLCILNNIFPKA